MRRPFALVGFTYLLVLVAAVFLGARWSMVLACVSLLFGAASLLLPRLRIGVFPVALCTAAMAFGSFSVFAMQPVQLEQTLGETDAVITGVLQEQPYRRYDRSYCVVQVTSVDGEPMDFQIRLSMQNGFAAEPYSRFEGKVHFYVPSGGTGFSSRAYDASQDISLLAFLYEYEPYTILPPAEKPLNYYILQLRSAMGDALNTVLPEEEAGLLRGVLLGDKTGISPELTEDFQTVGLSHLMAVSGLHMAIIMQLFFTLFLTLRIPRKLAAFLTSFAVLGFMAVTCFVPSASRSGVMCLLFLAGQIISHRADSLNSLGLAVWILCLINPYAAADIGLLLSFSATLGLILLARPATRWLNRFAPKEGIWKRFFHAVNSGLGTSISAVLFTLPVMALTFHNVSIIAFLANLLALWPATFMLQFALGAAVLYLVLPHTLSAMPFAFAAGWIAKYLCACVRALSDIPYASLPLSAGFVLLWIAAVLALTGAALWLGKSKRLASAAVWLSVILLLSGVYSYQLSMHGVTRIAVLDVGEGLSVAVTRDGRSALIGCSGYSAVPVKSYLKGQGTIGLDYVELFSDFGQEAGNAAAVLQTFPAEQLVLPSGAYMDDLLQKQQGRVKEFIFYKNAVRAELWGSVSIEMQDGAALLVANGVSVLLLPEKQEAADAPEAWRTADFVVYLTSGAAVLKAGDEGYAHNMDEGPIVLEITGEKTVKIRRDI